MLAPMQANTSRSIAACALALLTGAARAETPNVSANGFTSNFREEVKASTDDVWKAIVQLPRWWSGQHTYSGQAANMSLEAQAGGCWCERWGDGNSVQHGTVVLAQPGRVMRLYANLGPLQDLPVHGVLTIATALQDSKTILRISYRVGGPPDVGLEKLAPVVDQVIAQQYKRLKALVETGKPE
jgi:uncharacterized protein YndB with AHSA1/START domain